MIDTEQLIKYIERLVNNLQAVEKLVNIIYKKASSPLKDAHIHIINLVSESSL